MIFQALRAGSTRPWFSTPEGGVFLSGLSGHDLSDLPDSNSWYLLIRFPLGRDAKSARASHLVRDGNAAGHDVITKDVIARPVTALDAVALGNS